MDEQETIYHDQEKLLKELDEENLAREQQGKEELIRWLATTTAEYVINDSGKKVEVSLGKLFFNLRFKTYLIRDFLKLDKTSMSNALKTLPKWFLENITPSDNVSLSERQNLQTIFSKIIELDRNLLAALIANYVTKYDYRIFHIPDGGRKLSRRRKSNPKSKSKHNKRRSYKKSSFRRQRH
jgi:hypothetical protein